jgi:hypothetical protein
MLLKLTLSINQSISQCFSAKEKLSLASKWQILIANVAFRLKLSHAYCYNKIKNKTNNTLMDQQLSKDKNQCQNQ